MELRQAELFTLAGSDKLEEVTLLWNPKVTWSEIHQWKHMMSIAVKAITLVIDCWFLQTYDLELLGCHGSFFSNLRRLQCELTSQWLPNLIVTLGNCPILEHLCFQEYYVFAGETRPWGFQYDNHWESTRKTKNQKAKKLVKESERNSFGDAALKVVEMVGFEREEVLMELVEFILGKAATLESLTVYYGEFDEASDETFEQIKSFYRASPFVKLVSIKATGDTLYGMVRVCTRNYDFGG